jgi:predicted RNA-binding protein YlqC (UPF0109 family)
MTIEQHGPNTDTLELLADMFRKVDNTVVIDTEEGASETWLSIKPASTRSFGKFIGKGGCVFNAFRQIATVYSGVDKHRYMLRVCEID